MAGGVIEQKEGAMAQGTVETIRVRGAELRDKLNEVIREGNARRIMVKNDQGRTVIQLPLSFGLIGIVAAPLAVAIGALVGMSQRWTLEVERDKATTPTSTS